MSRRREWFSSFALVLGVVSALAMTGIAGYRLVWLSPPRVRPRPQFIKNWKRLTTDGIRLGADQPRVTIVEFADFQCRFCAALSRSLDTVLTRYPNDVQLIGRQFPLTNIHPLAFEAATASLCAAEQHAYHDMRTVLFSRQDSLSANGWTILAGAAGVSDTSAFAACMRARRFDDMVERDVAVGEKIGVAGTPTLVVNGTVLEGAIGADSLDTVVRRMMR